eukprot:3537365-Karenia_brevis.AAC.1
MVEIDTHSCTHYCKEGNYENRLDRIFWSLPPWASRHLSIVRPYFAPAQEYHGRKLSDHSPVGVSVSPRAGMHPSLRPIPSFVSKHPYFRAMLQQLEDEL